MHSLFRILAALILILVAFIPARAQQSYPALCRTDDASLQQGLEEQLSSLGLQKAVQKKSLSVAVADITDLTSPRLAAVNGDEMMYAASLPKIAILLGAFERIAQGEMALDEDTLDKLTRMIRNSSNEAATEMLNRVGKPYLATLLQSPPYRLYDPDQNGGLWVGKDYGKAPAWKRDPLHNLSHGATALQTARFYYLLETGQLVSPEMSQMMKTILGDPAIHHKFVKGLEEARPGSRIYRKSGTWKQYHSDSAIVERVGRRYIAVALAESPKGGKWLRRLIVAVDDLIFCSQKKPTQISRLGDKTRPADGVE
ncbi:MAG: serine hydrolase [Anaerolineales bacterium]|nr:serine hydrolase [Candidatus Latescibacterota bacterium]NIO77067.1 serine hydrolase [Candidatus Latescibacterota bacterium]NIS79898.1 serine hydrolase [Anaerolineales bacterium]